MEVGFEISFGKDIMDDFDWIFFMILVKCFL